MRYKILQNISLLLGDSDERLWFFQPWHRSKIRKFKNLHEGEDCFILATGNSLNRVDLTLLKDYHLFGLNKIYFLFDRVDLNLSYYVAVDKHVIPQSKHQIENMKCPSFISFEYGRNVINETDNVIFLLTKGGHYFSTNLEYKFAVTNTVSFVALQLAFYMGFKNVFLVGFDHDYKSLSGEPETSQVLHGEDPNHFDKRYFANQLWVQPDTLGMEVGYTLANYYYIRNNRMIYNATDGSKINIFQKISFEDALRKAKKKKPSSHPE
jgi:hypothetical protein